MTIEHIPLLKMQRDLHDIPRGMERFAAYLKSIVNDAGDDVEFPPLVGINPMAREHVAERLDELLALDADTIAGAAVAEVIQRVGDGDLDLKHGLVVLDDVRGGWTNRTTVDFGLRFGGTINPKRPWITTGWWVSETPMPLTVRQVVLQSVYRVIYVHQNGVAQTLREKLQQERAVGLFAGLQPRYDADELDYTRQVIEPYLDSTDYAVTIAAVYGNQAANSLGYTPLGLSENAGLEVALSDIYHP